MLFQNENIILRAVEPSDLDTLYVWENDISLWVAGNARNPYSRFALKQYIADFQKDIYESRQLRLMIDHRQTQKSVGTVDLYDFDLHHSKIALGLFVEQQYQGKGYAWQALEIVEDYVFNFLKINQLYVFIAKNNKASRNIFERKNYYCQTRLREWIKTADGFEDVFVYQKFREM
ncbi:MAG: GNAT family N-acetyltransferase [Paludibacter sp.]|nr:GNAT family N-acetyltransferase [Paludibacter sp.]